MAASLGPQQIHQRVPGHTRGIVVEREIHEKRQLLLGSKLQHVSVQPQQYGRTEHLQVEGVRHVCFHDWKGFNVYAADQRSVNTFDRPVPRVFSTCQSEDDRQRNSTPSGRKGTYTIYDRGCSYSSSSRSTSTGCSSALRRAMLNTVVRARHASPWHRGRRSGVPPIGPKLGHPLAGRERAVRDG